MAKGVVPYCALLRSASVTPFSGGSKEGRGEKKKVMAGGTSLGVVL